MVDDIVQRGVDEPYRLFTSRAEYRLQLREDNVFERLGAHALRLGLVARNDHDRQMRRLAKRRQRDRGGWPRHTGEIRRQERDLFQILKRPEMTFAGLEELQGRPLLQKT